MSRSNHNQVITRLSSLFDGLSHPTRIEILLAIGNRDVCVCHLEKALGMRQAYISQHLMAMRDSGVITSRREGRFIFYQIADEKLAPLLLAAAAFAGIDPEQVHLPSEGVLLEGCGCPKCSVSSNPVFFPESLVAARSFSAAAPDNG